MGVTPVSGAATTMAFPVRLKTPLQFDPLLLGIVLAILLGGLVVLASASTSISESVGGHPFYYLQRQLVAVVAGLLAGGVCLFIPMQFWRQMGPVLLLAGLALLLVVLIPGVGAQGGDAAAVMQAAATEQGHVLVNSSRQILYASAEKDFAEAAGHQAEALRTRLAPHVTLTPS